MSAGHYENFPVASRLLPRATRAAVLAIYRFARGADDLADEGDATPAERLAALDRYGAALDAIAAGATPSVPPFAELAAAIRAHDLPLPPFHDLLSAFRQDVVKTRYETFADLADYACRSANPVGRLLLRLWRADTPANLAASDAICSALQYANFWQDVGIDWAKGRVYLPQEDLARYGVTEDAIAHADVDARFRDLMAFETGRTRALLESGRPLLGGLPWRARLEIGGVLAGGHRVLDRIDAVGGDVFRARPALGGLDWMRVALSALGGLVPTRRGPADAS